MGLAHGKNRLLPGKGYLCDKFSAMLETNTYRRRISYRSDIPKYITRVICELVSNWQAPTGYTDPVGNINHEKQTEERLIISFTENCLGIWHPNVSRWVQNYLRIVDISLHQLQNVDLFCPNTFGCNQCGNSMFMKAWTPPPKKPIIGQGFKSSKQCSRSGLRLGFGWPRNDLNYQRCFCLQTKMKVEWPGTVFTPYSEPIMWSSRRLRGTFVLVTAWYAMCDEWVRSIPASTIGLAGFMFHEPYAQIVANLCRSGTGGLCWPIDMRRTRQPDVSACVKISELKVNGEGEWRAKGDWEREREKRRWRGWGWGQGNV